jgi:hypothetical protein
MFRAAIAVGAAVLSATLLIVLPGMTPRVAAGTPQPEAAAPVHAAVQQPVAKADRLDRVPGAGCSQRAWPYYDQDCLVDFDARWRGEPRKVRLITTDRLQ